ncbi:MAG TPA: sugar phosphate nucleotidyltransferase [Bacillota bacterium]|nr:sugar phosphate nucleotidyltransferase [Bacillota bacterium]
MVPIVHVVIMAGGKGERFWPVSRKRVPKQLLRLFGEETLLEAAYRRALSLAAPEAVYVVTGMECSDGILAQLPGMPRENLLIEPEGKNTAACIALAAVVIEHRDPDGVMVVLPSDQQIGDAQEFGRLIDLAVKVAVEQETLVTLGIHPTRPETAFGYMEMGVPESGYPGVYRVGKFHEKPELATAEQYVASGGFLWNSGIFVWKSRLILSMIATYLPNLDREMQMLKPAIGTRDFDRRLKSVYAKLESISVDYGILERADSVHVIPASMEWDDIGSWSAMRRVWPGNDRDNVGQGEYLGLESRENIVYSPRKRVVTLGVRGMVIAETEDCLVVFPADRDQEIKSIMEQLRQRGWEELL